MKNTRKTALFAALLACSLVFAFVEALFPLDFIAPGIKLGLANSVVLLLVCAKRYKTAAFVNLCRIIISTFLFSNLMGLIYALSGAFFAYIVMFFASKTRIFGIIGISVLGGVFHNAAQLLAAYIIIENSGVFFYLPVLLISGVVSGALIGLCGAAIFKNKNIQKFLNANT